MDYSVVIPVYNSSQSLKEIVDEVESVFQSKIEARFEIIFVDDASPNQSTWPVIRSLCDGHSGVRGIRLMRNFGKPGALFCGLHAAKGNYIITMDDDLQHNPADIPALIERQEHDVVIGRFRKKKHSIFKVISSKITGWFDYKLIGKPKHISNSPFKLFNREVLNSVLQFKTAHPFISALVFYATTDIVNVDLTHHKRKYEVTGYTFRKMTRQFSNLIINNSSLLLKLIAFLGIIIASMSFVLAIYLIFKKIFIGINTPGWTTTMVVMLLTSGLVLFSIGIMGEYLIRIINNVEKKPPFLIRDIYEQ